MGKNDSLFKDWEPRKPYPILWRIWYLCSPYLGVPPPSGKVQFLSLSLCLCYYVGNMSLCLCVHTTNITSFLHQHNIITSFFVICDDVVMLRVWTRLHSYALMDEYTTVYKAILQYWYHTNSQTLVKIFSYLLCITSRHSNNMTF